MTQRIIVREPWSYVLFEEHGEFILTFLLSGTTDTEFSVKLTQVEIDLQRQDMMYAERLVRRLSGNRNELYGRCLLQAVWPAPAA